MSSTHTKIEKDIEFLTFIKALLEERMSKSALDDPRVVPINLPDYLDAWTKVVYSLDEAQYKLTVVLKEKKGND